jgi:vacuolar protein sorting-associated protein 41
MANSHTPDDTSMSLNGWHSPVNGNGKAELPHLNLHDDDENASNRGYTDQESAVHDSEGGEDEDESGEEDDEDEEEEDEGEDDHEDEEEDEPTLKYERMSGPINDLLKKDSASALAVSNKLLVNSSITLVRA